MERKRGCNHPILLISIYKFNCLRNFYLNRTLICNYWISVQKVFKTRLSIEKLQMKRPDCQFIRAWLRSCTFVSVLQAFPQKYGLHKSLLFVLNKYDYFLSFSLWFLKPNLVHATKAYLPKHLTILAISLPKPPCKEETHLGSLYWSLGITYFRWLFAPLFKSEPWIIKLSMISEQVH